MCSQVTQRSEHAAVPAALFRAWLARANPGERLEYHRGYLTVDRSPGSRLAEHDRRAVTELAGAAREAAETDQVHLVQRRNGPADFSYLAIKTLADARRAVAAPAVVNAASTTHPAPCLGWSA